MSERKVLNKYYPPDFDPGKIKRVKREKTRQYTVRIMAPCNMRCNTCHDYIARGKKFNARKETVQDEEYLNLKIFRFYFRCPVCMQEITFKTDPKNFDYVVESGATPNFKALKLAHQQAIEEQKAIEEEEKLNPVKMLENRTLASRREMENLEALEDLREINLRSGTISHDDLLAAKQDVIDQEMARQEAEDEAFVQSVFGKPKGHLSTIPEDGEDGDEGDEVTEEIGDLFDLYPQLKAEIDASKQEGTSGSTKKVTDSLSAVPKPASKLSKLSSAIIIKKRPIESVEPSSKETGSEKKVKTVDAPTSGPVTSAPPANTGLSLLGGYSDSDDDD